MSYDVFLLRRAQKTLSKIRPRDFERLQVVIREVSEEPRPQGCHKLGGREGWRVRVGEYRVIYEIEEAECEVTVLDVGDRRDIYR